MKLVPSVVVFKILDKPTKTCSLLSVVLTGKIAGEKKSGNPCHFGNAKENSAQAAPAV